MSDRTLGAVSGNYVSDANRFQAWVVFYGTSGLIKESFNVSSVTHTGTGVHTVTFAQAFASTKYAAVVGMGRLDALTTGINAGIRYGVIPAATSLGIETRNAVGNTLTDPEVVQVAVVGRV